MEEVGIQRADGGRQTVGLSQCLAGDFSHTLDFTKNKLGKEKCVALRMALVCPLCLWQTSHSAAKVLCKSTVAQATNAGHLLPAVIQWPPTKM